MKRKSTLLLIAVLALAISIPVFAMAEDETTAVQALDGTGNMFGRGNGFSAQAALQAGDPLLLQDCDEEDCDCEALGTGLGADGEALRQFVRGSMGRGMTADQTETQASGIQPMGGRGRRGSN